MYIVPMAGHGNIGEILGHLIGRQQISLIHRRSLGFVDRNGPSLVKIGVEVGGE